MLTIPSTVQALFKTDGVHKNFRVHFPNGEFPDITNDNVVQESVKFTESLCSQSTFKFGLAEASVLEFQTVGIGNMYGMTIEAGIEIDCSSLSAAQKTAIASGTWDGTWDSVNEVFYIPYGTFRVESCPRDHQSMAHRQVTAYSTDLLSGVAFPNLSMAKGFQMSLNGILATKSGTGLTEETAATISALEIKDPSAGSIVSRIPGGCIDGGYYNATGLSQPKRTKFVWLCTGTTSSPINAINDAVLTEDVILPTGSVDSLQVSKLISVIADQLTNAGVDLTLDSYLTQVYSDNLESLQKECLAFYPSINDLYDVTTALLKPRTTWSNYPCDNRGEKSLAMYVHHSYPAVLNQYNPVIAGRDTTSAFYCTTYTSFGSPQRTDLYFIKILTSDNVFLRVFDTADDSVSFIKLRYAADHIDLLPFLTKDMNITSVRQFSVDTPSPYFAMNNTGKYSTYYYAYLGGEKNLTAIIKGALELFAMFYKADRFGGGEAVLLDDSSPISVSPGNYAECWWDEYDVDPIGIVTFTYQGDAGDGNAEENAVEVSIGSGLSRYDMADNDAIKNLSGMTLDAVTNLINTTFAPNAGTVAFTPTELTMQGWPWIEAGDALQITAEDGTVVDTYALRVEMDGIQHLQAAITAEGGEIIEEVS